MTPTAITQHQYAANALDASAGSGASNSAETPTTLIAFEGFSLVAHGDLLTVATAAKHAHERTPSAPLLVLDAVTSRPVELDLRGELEQVLARLTQTDADAPTAGAETADGGLIAAAGTAGAGSTAVGSARPTSATRSAGRPRLGVVAREVTLLPRHWAWLADQPGGASAALRRLVDQARVDYAARDALRHAQESAYRFMSTLLGDQSDYDEAARALFSGHREEFRALVRDWPADARDHLLSLAEVVFNS